MLSSSSRQLDIGAGTNQIEVGLKLTQLTGGRYEAIAAQTRLTSLLPEFATQIARSQVAAVQPVPDHLPAAGRLQAAAHHRRDAARRYLRGAHLRRARSLTYAKHADDPGS